MRYPKSITTQLLAKKKSKINVMYDLFFIYLLSEIMEIMSFFKYRFEKKKKNFFFFALTIVISEKRKIRFK